MPFLISTISAYGLTTPFFIGCFNGKYIFQTAINYFSFRKFIIWFGENVSAYLNSTSKHPQSLLMFLSGVCAIAVLKIVTNSARLITFFIMFYSLTQKKLLSASNTYGFGNQVYAKRKSCLFVQAAFKLIGY